MHASHAEVSAPVLHADVGAGAGTMTTAPPVQYRDCVRLHDVRLSTQRPATHDAESQLTLPVPQSQHVDTQSAGDEHTSPAAFVPCSNGDDAGHKPLDWSDASSPELVTAPPGAPPKTASPSDRFQASPGWRSQPPDAASAVTMKAVVMTARTIMALRDLPFPARER